MILRYEVKSVNPYHLAVARNEPQAVFRDPADALEYAERRPNYRVYDRERCEYLDDRDGSFHA